MNPYARKTIVFMLIALPMLITGCNKPTETTGKPTSIAPEAHTATTSINDSEVTSRVKSALVQDDILKTFEITVATLKGDVRITGIVNNQAQIDHADKLLHSIEGVHTIHDELTIKK
jgi:hyperosmotically inducible protein